MRLRPIVNWLKRYEHLSHHAILVLVAVSLLAYLIKKYAPELYGPMKTWIDHLVEFLHLFALLLVLLILGIRHFLIRSPNLRWVRLLSKEDLAIIRGWLKGKSRRVSVGFKPPPGSCEFVDKTSPSLSQIQFTLNLEGFEQTHFELTSEEITRRNSRWLEKNPLLFMLVRDPLVLEPDSSRTPKPDQFIGYSSILPLNAQGMSDYLNGRIKDRHLSADLICGTKEPANALVIFAIMLKKPYCKSRNLAAHHYLYFLLGCVLYHVNVLLAEHPLTSGKVELWAQAEHPRIRKLLRLLEFQPTGKQSGDGLEFYKLEILTN